MTWMAWTLPTAVFFIGIAVLLVTMTLLELKRPTRLTRRFLPVATTRGDRIFISLLSAAFIHLIWLGLVGSLVWVASLIALAFAAFLLLRG